MSIFMISAHASLPTLSADDPLEFNQETRELKASGRASLVHDQFSMDADEVRFSQDRGTVLASGNVRLNSKNFRALTEEISYSTLNQEMEATAYKLGTYPQYITGENIYINHTEGERKVVTKGSTLYYGEPDFFTPRMRASELKGWPGEIVEGRHVIFKLGHVPVFYTPYAVADTKQSLVNIRSEVGDQKNLGIFLRNDVYIQMYKNFKPGFLFDYYRKKGLLYGPAWRYSSETYKGGLKSGYIRDHGDKSENILGSKIPDHRYFVDVYHIQEIDHNITLTGHFVKWSDAEATRDFRPRLFENNQQPDTFGEVSYAGSDYLISAFTRVRTNKFQLVEQRVPEVRFDYFASQIGSTPLYHSGYGSYSRIIERTLDTSPNIATDKWDGYYGIHLPISVTHYMTFNPVAGARINHYEFDQTPSGKLTRITSEVGFDTEVRAYGEWDYTNKFWDIQGLRHSVTPFLQYRNIQHSVHGPIELENQDISDQGFLLDPIELGSRRKLYPKADHHIVRIGLENSLQTRHKDYGSRNLAVFSIFHDAGFSRHETQTHSMDLYTRTGVSPAYWLDFNAYNRFDSRKAKLEEFYTSTTVKDGDVWNLSLATSHARGGIRQFGWTYDYQLTARHFIKGQWYFDDKLHKMTLQKYSFKAKMGNSWWVTYELVFRRASSRTGSFQYNVSFDLIRY